MATDTFTPATRNVTRIFRAASDSHVERGMRWYADAREVASALAVRNNVSVEVATGVIAATSPLNSWGANVNLSARLLAAGGLDSGYLSIGLAKANAIVRDGVDPLDVLTSDKVKNFYLSILSGGDDGVCIDRHAYSLAVNHRFAEGKIPSLTGKRYAATADTYRRAGDILGVAAARVQAVTWLAWRARFWAEGAWDSHSVAV